ncbi:hypothetical protein U1Q18_003379 [Sarracenia purpurea var. burkii]
MRFRSGPTSPKMVALTGRIQRLKGIYPTKMCQVLLKAVSGGEVPTSEVPESVSEEVVLEVENKLGADVDSEMGDRSATQGGCENRSIKAGIDVDGGNGEVEEMFSNSGSLFFRDSKENEDCVAEGVGSEPLYQTSNLDYVLELNDIAMDVDGVEKGVMPLRSEIQNANNPDNFCDAHNLFDRLLKQNLSETKEEVSSAPCDEVPFSLGSEFAPIAGIKVSSECKCVVGTVKVGGVIVDDYPAGQKTEKGGSGERDDSAHHMLDKMTKLEESSKPGPEESSFEGSCASDDSDVSSCSDDPEYVEVERDPFLNEKGVSVSEVVTGEGTENEVSLEPSLFFNCDRDSAIAIEDVADVGLKVKQVKETNEDLCSARQVFEFLPKPPPGANFEPNAKVLAPKFQGSVGTNPSSQVRAS